MVTPIVRQQRPSSAGGNRDFDSLRLQPPRAERGHVVRALSNNTQIERACHVVSEQSELYYMVREESGSETFLGSFFGFKKRTERYVLYIIFLMYPFSHFSSQIIFQTITKLWSTPPN